MSGGSADIARELADYDADRGLQEGQTDAAAGGTDDAEGGKTAVAS